MWLSTQWAGLLLAFIQRRPTELAWGSRRGLLLPALPKLTAYTEKQLDRTRLKL